MEVFILEAILLGYCTLPLSRQDGCTHYFHIAV